MQKLVDFLKNLKSNETQWSLYVNPDDVDQFCVGQSDRSDEDGWICVGTLQKLSCGSQSKFEALESFLLGQTSPGSDDIAELEFKGRPVRVNIPGILDRWSAGLLDQELFAFLEANASRIQESWAEQEAWVLAERIAQQVKEAA